MQDLESRIATIEKRNARVEIDKAWETSLTRKVCIMVLTYSTIAVFFFVASLPDPFVNAVVPSIAFFLSTLTMGVIKKYWIRKK